MGKKLCLLRGINVGGKNIIKMTDLRACLEEAGLENVETYIQSGNVTFSSSKSNATLTQLIEKSLLNTFGYKEPVLVIADKKLDSIISSAPQKFGRDPDNYKYDVIYIVKEITAKAFAKIVTLREGVDNVYIGKGVLYFSRLKSKVSKSYLSKIVSKPEYKLVTIRNWNTTIKLREKLNSKNY